jgi:hypothetical protein
MSHGGLATTPTRKLPRCLIASIRGLSPGLGTAWAFAAAVANTKLHNAARPIDLVRNLDIAFPPPISFLTRCVWPRFLLIGGILCEIRRSSSH